MERRQQHFLTAVVNYGIALAAESVLDAARYMADLGVPIQVAKRVLLKPAQSRSR
jgi:predicted amino acid racemase